MNNSNALLPLLIVFALIAGSCTFWLQMPARFWGHGGDVHQGWYNRWQHLHGQQGPRGDYYGHHHVWHNHGNGNGLEDGNNTLPWDDHSELEDDDDNNGNTTDQDISGDQTTATNENDIVDQNRAELTNDIDQNEENLSNSTDQEEPSGIDLNDQGMSDSTDQKQSSTKPNGTDQNGQNMLELTNQNPTDQERPSDIDQNDQNLLDPTAQKDPNGIDHNDQNLSNLTDQEQNLAEESSTMPDSFDEERIGGTE